jgi:hypothetical protein
LRDVRMSDGTVAWPCARVSGRRDVRMSSISTNSAARRLGLARIAVERADLLAPERPRTS